MQRHAFRAMGTDVELMLAAPSSAETLLVLASAQREMTRLERLLSRFRDDSELSALNRAGRLQAGPELVQVTELAVAAADRTGGRFDATVHDAVVAAGYDRTFEHLEEVVEVVPREAACGGTVVVDVHTGLIELEPGYRLDLGGIAKGYAVDRLCELLAPHGPCLVDAGGDIAVRGAGWPIGVATAESVVTLELNDAAVATSGVDRRTWRTTTGDAHHLIDPATGRPALVDLLRVTVVADTAVDAEVLAKALFLAGADRAALEANETGTPAVLVTAGGRTVFAGGLE